MPEICSRTLIRSVVLSGLVVYAGCTAQTTTLRPEGPGETPAQPASPVVAQAEPARPSGTPTPSAEPAPSQPPLTSEPAPQPPSGPEQPATEVTPATPVQITGVQVEQHGPSSVTITITADGPASSYESFSLPDPPRIVIDIPNARRALTSQNGEWKAGPISQVRIAQYRERPVPTVRVVVDLREPLSYKLAVSGNQYKVSVGEAPPPTQAALPAAPAPEKKEEAPAVPQPEAGKVAKLEFQTPPGKSRIVISTAGRVSYNLAELTNPPRLVIDILDAVIEAEAQQGLGAQQLGGPVERVRAAQYQQDPQKIVRVVTDLKQAVKYEIQQTPESIVLDLITPTVTAERPVPPPPPAPVVPPAPSPERVERPAPPSPPVRALPPRAPAPEPLRPALAPQPVRGRGRLSMDFKDAEITNLLRIIAEVSGLNVVVSDEVKGKITVRLVNVEWPQALDVILKTSNLGYVQDGNILRVASQASIQKEKEERARALTEEAKAQEAQVQLEPLVMRVLAVNYARAEDMAKQLDRLKTKTRGTITPDGRTNTVIVEDVAAAIEKMEGLLKRLDIPTPQVFIEARIVEATRGFSRSLGIEWGFAGVAQTHPPINFFSSRTGTDVAPPTTTVPLFLNFPASGTNPSAIAMTVGSFASAFFGARLSAAESENKVKTLSAPKIATLDNEEAEIKQGTQIPFTTVDSSGRTVISFVDAFIRLKVKPHITNDQRISMKVEAERSFPGDRIDFAGGFAFPINTRKATTNILIPNGGTVVIGGLLQITERESETRLPFLAKIPVLGYLFKSHAIGPDDKAELLVFMTPRILQEPRVAQQRP